MSPAKLTDFPLLLEVFRDGLEYGIISKDEIVAWADKIIANEEEPDYFFIEISMSGDINNLSSLLKTRVPVTHNPVSGRAILGMAYQRLLSGTINIDNVITAVNGFSYEGATFAEDDFLSGLTYDYEMLFRDGPSGPDKLKEKCLSVLSIYKDFQVGNYEQWPEINRNVEDTLKPEEEKLQASRMISKKAWKKREAKRKLKRYALFSIPVFIILGIILIDYNEMQGEPTVTKMLLDHEYIFFLNVFGVYFIVRTVYILWKKVRRIW